MFKPNRTIYGLAPFLIYTVKNSNSILVSFQFRTKLNTISLLWLMPGRKPNNSLAMSGMTVIFNYDMLIPKSSHPTLFRRSGRTSLLTTSEYCWSHIKISRYCLRPFRNYNDYCKLDLPQRVLVWIDMSSIARSPLLSLNARRNTASNAIYRISLCASVCER